MCSDESYTVTQTKLMTHCVSGAPGLSHWWNLAPKSSEVCMKVLVGFCCGDHVNLIKIEIKGFTATHPHGPFWVSALSTLRYLLECTVWMV